VRVVYGASTELSYRQRDALSREYMPANDLDQRHQRGNHGANPVSKRRHIQINPFARAGIALAIER
jgi:hypothetical protein